jgi:transcriptional regulator with XRE-family HTH domain
MNIGKAIKTIRQEKGIKQKELAEILGMKYVQRLAFIENHQGGLTKAMERKILAALNISKATLVLRALEEKDFDPEQKELAKFAMPMIIKSTEKKEK